MTYFTPSACFQNYASSAAFLLLYTELCNNNFNLHFFSPCHPDYRRLRRELQQPLNNMNKYSQAVELH